MIFTIKEINLDHFLFIDLNGENMLLLHSDYGFVMKTLQQAELCSLYREIYIFKRTFYCAPHYFYQMCPFRLYIPQHKKYELGAIAILTVKTAKYIEYTFKVIKDNINKFSMCPSSFYSTFFL